MREPGVLVVELGPVDGKTAGAVAVGRVTTLHHEVFDDSVEDTALVVELSSLLSSTESSEVLSGLGDMLWEQLEHYATLFWLLIWILTTDFDVEEYLGVALFESGESRDSLFGLGRSSLFSIESLS